MRKFFAWTYLIAAIILTLWVFHFVALHGSAPTITLKDVEQITVTYDEGAVWACTNFYEARVTEKIGDPNFPDGHYKPMHCYELSPKSTGYNDDWEYILKYDDDWTVWSDITYLDVKGNPHAVSTQKVKVHR
jgi:hypothetical protein